MESVQTLVESGLGGTLSDGDSIGLWTYEDALHSGGFPVLPWSAANAKKAGEALTGYLKKYKYQEKPDLEPVIRPLTELVMRSHSLVVLHYSTGTQPMYGTPFDQAINLFQLGQGKELDKSKVPVLVTLIAQRGEFRRYSVGPALGDVTIPKFVPEAELPPPNRPAPLPVAQEAPPPPPPVKVAAEGFVITKNDVVKTSVEPPPSAPQIAPAPPAEETSVPPTVTEPAPVSEPAAVEVVTKVTPAPTVTKDAPPPAPVAVPAPVVNTPPAPAISEPAPVSVPPAATALTPPPVAPAPAPAAAPVVTPAASAPVPASPAPAERPLVSTVTVEKSTPWPWIIAAGCFIVFAIIAAFFLGRTTRQSQPQSSLISSSIEKKKR